MRVVMVTYPSGRADAILAALADRQVPVDAIVVDRGRRHLGDGVRRARQVMRRSGPRAVLRRLEKRAKRAATQRGSGPSDRDRYEAFCSAVHFVDDINDDAGTEALSELAPDLVVLGASRILKDHIIDIPPMGVLNAHPGVLPAYRGVDVVPWAVLNGDPLGVTVHYVDSGIDTGPSVAQRLFHIEPGDTVAALQARSDQLAGQLMAEVVAQLAHGEPLEVIPLDGQPSHLYTRMSPDEQRRVEEILAQRMR